MASSSSILNSQADKLELDADALSAMNWALVRGIVQGADGALLPQGSCSCVQIVTMLHRLLVQ